MPSQGAEGRKAWGRINGGAVERGRASFMKVLFFFFFSLSLSRSLFGEHEMWIHKVYKPKVDKSSLTLDRVPAL